ncbi:hypothetical protein J3R30DRAFT_1800784 [Lentinula aciculospora]|uniref:Uncharacterized protein n=1 Tax=Lentinula aciculospora TaxID=153920 RepID=A0A9W9AII7_9AGAR|nr:hypothetical protein J3R30DRAFT_1800784 [Lentinula aciculospora]
MAVQSGDPPTLESSTGPSPPSLISPTTSSLQSHPLSRKSSVSSQTEIDISIEALNPTSDLVLGAQHSIEMMHENLEALEQTLRNLADGRGLLAENSELDSELQKIYDDLATINKNQVDGTEEIELLMHKFLNETAMKRIEEEVNKEIQDNMDKLVKEEVEAYLETAISLQLQKDLLQRKKELDQVHRNLHDSESKRLNSLLSERNINEPMHTIYRSNGEISKHFPKTLNELFSFDADTCKALVIDYDIDSPEGTSRRGNLNRFMVFCGLQLSMIAND